jgi:excisionase family DNA binding protein
MSGLERHGQVLVGSPRREKGLPPFRELRSIKGPQRCAALNFQRHRAESMGNPGPVPSQGRADPSTTPTRMEDTMPFTPTPLQNERQLVFTASQAARYLGVSLATIRRWADAGHLSCYRTPGGQRRFSREQLDNFISSLDHPSNSTHRVANVA